MILHNEDWCFSEETGEVFLYEKVGYKQTEENTTPLHYTLSRDEPELFDCVRRHNERRFGDVFYSLEKEKLGKWYIPVLKLCARVSYFNVGFYSRSDISSTLGVKESSLNKTLNKLSAIGLLTYTGKGLTSQQQVKVIWNPLNVWKGWINSPTRTIAIQDWYKGYFKGVSSEDISVESEGDISTLEVVEDINVISPDPYVSNHFNLMSKDRFGYLMSLSDADFELYLLGIS